MKKTKLFELLVLNFLLMLIGFSFIACGDDEPFDPPSITLNFTNSTLSTSETDGTQQITIDFDEPSPFDGSFMITLSGSATYGDDFTTTPEGTSGSFSLPIATDAESVSFMLTPNDDDIAEEDENIVFTLSSITNMIKIGDSDELTVTLTSEDLAGPAELGFAESRLTVLETDVEQQVTIDLDAPAPVSGSVMITLSGTATYGDDFTTTPEGTSGSFSLPITEGDESVTFMFTPNDDDAVEGDENVLFTLSSTEEKLTVANDKNILIITLNSEDVGDPNEPITLDFVNTALTISETENSQQILVNFSNQAPASGSVTVTLSGTGVYGEDYTTMPEGSSGSIVLSIAEDDQSASFSFIPIDDQEVENDRNIVFTLSSTEEKLTVGNDNELTVTLTSDDVGDPIELNFTQAQASFLSESNGDEEIIIFFDGPAPVDGSVQIILTGSAIYDEDYTTSPEATSGVITLDISKDDEQLFLFLMPIEDEESEPEESITLTLSSDNESFIVGNENILQISLTDE